MKNTSESSSVNKRLIAPQDLHNFRFVHAPSISPDGNNVIFILSQTKNDQEYSGAVWKYKVESGRLSSIIDSGYRISSPKWSPSGDRLLYLVNNGSELELWVCDAQGYDKRKIASVRGRKIVDPKWSRDGRYIYFLSDFQLEKAENSSDVRVITRRFYRFDGEGYQHDRRIHVFRVDAQGIHGSEMTRLTSGSYDVVAYDVSPDGSQVAFVANMDRDADIQNNADIYTVSTFSSRSEVAPKKIYASRGPISSVSYSPDGNYLAFIGNDYRFKFNTPEEVWLLDPSQGKVSNISHALNRPARNAVGSDASMDSWDLAPAWRGNDQVLFLATDRGRSNIYASNIESGKVSPVTSGDHVITSFTIAGNGTIAYVKMNPVLLPELFVLRDGQEVQATNFNNELLSRLVLTLPREFTFKARDGVEVHGFFSEPTLNKGGRPPPCIVQIHGGGGAEGFQFMHEFQCQAAQGFAILTCNFRGTQGYGEDYMRVLTGHYMEKDYADIIDMVEYALKQGWIDPKRVGVTGGSYGGYLTNWAISHDGDLFAAAVTDRSVVNLYSFYGTSDDYRLIEEDVQVSFPWDRPEHYISKSPIGYTKNVSTPLLIIHSEEDYRCPLEQAEQLYAFLKRQGKEVVLVVFPGENHGLSRGGKPHHRIERLLFNLWWFTSHIDAGSSVEPPLPVTA